MNEKNTAQTQKEEREEVLKEIRQLESYCSEVNL